MIHVKRVYEAATRDDGQRFLVERLWPRGIRKESLSLSGWCQAVAPSHELRKWFSHDPARWKEFQRRYRAELNDKPETWQPLLEAVKKDNLTLLFSARDTEHNNAVALKAFLDEQLKTGAK